MPLLYVLIYAYKSLNHYIQFNPGSYSGSDIFPATTLKLYGGQLTLGLERPVNLK